MPIYAGNADLLVGAVTIITRRKEGGNGERGIEMEGLEVEIREEIIGEIENLPP